MLPSNSCDRLRSPNTFVSADVRLLFVLLCLVKNPGIQISSSTGPGPVLASMLIFDYFRGVYIDVYVNCIIKLGCSSKM